MELFLLGKPSLILIKIVRAERSEASFKFFKWTLKLVQSRVQISRHFLAHITYAKLGRSRVQISHHFLAHITYAKLGRSRVQISRHILAHITYAKLGLSMVQIGLIGYKGC